MTLVKPRGKGGGRKPKGGGRIGCRLNQPAMDQLAVLRDQWQCRTTDVLERLLAETDWHCAELERPNAPGRYLVWFDRGPRDIEIGLYDEGHWRTSRRGSFQDCDLHLLFWRQLPSEPKQMP